MSNLWPAEVDFHETWEKECRPLFDQLLSDGYRSFWRSSSVSGMELYSVIYRLCVAIPESHAGALFTSLGSLFFDKVTEYVKRLEETEPEAFLKAYSDYWAAFKATVYQVNNVCIYLNKMIKSDLIPEKECVVASSCGDKILVPVADVESMCWCIWLKTMLIYYKNHQTNDRVVQQIIAWSKDLRLQKPADLQVLQRTIESFHLCATKIGSRLYEESVEGPLLQLVSEFYSSASAANVQAQSLPQYLRFVEGVLRDEQRWNPQSLPSETNVKMTRVLETELVERHLGFIQEGIDGCLEARDQASLKLVYQYLKRFPGAIDTLETKLNAQSIKAGFDILSLFSKRDLLSNNMELVLLFGQLAELDYYLHTLIRESFASDPRFQQIQNQIFQKIAESNILSPRQPFYKILAHLFNEILSGAYKGASEADLDSSTLATSGIRMLNFLPAKDEFFQVYSRQLAYRLLYGKQVNLELEANIITDFQRLFHTEIVGKLRRMIADIRSSAQAESEFQQYLGSNSATLQTPSCKRMGNAGLNLHPVAIGQLGVQVLSSLAWPSSTDFDRVSIDLSFPELDSMRSIFEQYYLERNEGKRLAWCHRLSRAHLAYNSPVGKAYQLFVSFSQFQILMAFQHDSTQIFADLVRRLQLSRKEAYRQLKPLITIGILGWDSNVQSYAQVSDSQIVILNESFSHPKTKIRMAAEWPSDQEKPEDEAPRVMDIDEDSASAPFTDEKKIMIQSLLMRIMKVQRSLSKARLYQVVSEGWPRTRDPAPPTADMLSSMLGHLVEKGFLEYDEKLALYNYVA